MDFSTERLFHSFWRRICFLHDLALGAVAAKTVWSIGEGEGTVQVLMNCDRAAGQRGSPGYRLDLQSEILKTDCVIAVHHTLGVHGEDQVKIFAVSRYKGAAFLSGRNLEAGVEGLDKVLSQESIGLIQGTNAV